MSSSQCERPESFSHAPVAAGIARGVPALKFELDGVEGGLQEMDVAEVGVDHQLPIGPLRIFVSADQKFENEIVSGLKFVIGKRAEERRLVRRCHEKFVGELGEQRPMTTTHRDGCKP